jgi:alpha-glucosidase
MNAFSKLLDFLKRKLAFNWLDPVLNKRPVPRRWTYLAGFKNFNLNKEHTSLTMHCGNGRIILDCLTPSMWRIMVTGRGLASAQDTVFPKNDYLTWSVSFEKRARLIVQQQDGLLSIKSAHSNKEQDYVHAVFDTGSLTFKIAYGGRTLHKELRAPAHSGGWVACLKQAAEREHYCGFGEKTGGLFKNNRLLKMWNTNAADMNVRTDPLYQSCPLQIAVREDGFAHAMFFDNPHYCRFKLSETHGIPVTFYAAEAGPLCYYVIAGPRLKDVLSHFTELCGRYPLPPRWVLGHHHSRWEAKESAQRLLRIAEAFRKHKLPCDALHIDIGHMQGYRSFTWNKQRFPRPAQTIKKLKAHQFKVVVMSDPGLKKDEEWDVYNQGVKNGYFCTYENSSVYHGPVWPGDAAFPDFTSSEVRNWWGSLYRVHTELGIEGFWIDMNEPSVFTLRLTMPDDILHNGDKKSPALLHKTVHNCYGLLMAKATYQGLCNLRPGLRTFLFTRAAFAGIQRYASSWTGDNKSKWSHLRISIPMLLNMGLCGQVIVGPDIGGFFGKPSKELFLRWMQLGAFYPFSRNHTSDGTPPQEIWRFGEQAVNICRSILQIRYMLLPYFYTCVQQACQTGLPLMRPLFLEFPRDRNCYKAEVCSTEFLMGPDLLVAPILYAGKKERAVYLPQGNDWIDWYTSVCFKGGTWIQTEAPLQKIPLFVRRGAVIATSPPVETSEHIDKHPPVLLVYPDSTFKGTWYLDDGYSLKYEQGHYSLFSFQGKWVKNTLTLSIKRTSGKLVPTLSPYSDLVIKICLSEIPLPIKTILLGNKKLSQGLWQVRNSWCELKLKKPVLPLTLRFHY